LSSKIIIYIVVYIFDGGVAAAEYYALFVCMSLYLQVLIEFALRSNPFACHANN